ncbi:odorant receptor 4-like [Xylocopa sonorina]|uniref:odorant receptor 4-like n=1 Tax=Xylocopa sonorina TaxID=1818115 RepID=UPI00403A8784
MAQTRTPEQDLKHALRLVQPVMTLLGIWPSAVDASLAARLLRWSTVTIALVLQFLVLVPGILYVFLKEKSGRRKLGLLLPFIFSSGQLGKYIVILYRMKELRDALFRIREDWLSATEENRQVLRAKAEVGYTVMFLVTMTVYTSGLSNRAIIPLSKGRIVLPDNTTIRMLPCATHITLFDVQTTPYYEIVFALQVFSGLVSYSILSGTVGIFTILCLHICAMLRILIGKMLELTDRTDTDERHVQTKIVDIVEYQTKIKEFISNVELITQYLCFVEIIEDTSFMCIVGYCIILVRARLRSIAIRSFCGSRDCSIVFQEWKNQNITATIVFMWVMVTCVCFTFSICYVGQLLVDESGNLERTSNTLSWYRLPSRKARSLVPVIIMSNSPIKLTAAKVVEVSLSTFSDIVKASVGYLNILRTVI